MNEVEEMEGMDQENDNRPTQHIRQKKFRVSKLQWYLDFLYQISGLAKSLSKYRQSLALQYNNYAYKEFPLVMS